MEKYSTFFSGAFLKAITNASFLNGGNYLAAIADDVNIDFLRDFHTIIAGSDKDDNSKIMDNIILSLAIKNNADSIEMILIDPNCYHLRKYQKLPFVRTFHSYTNDDIKVGLQVINQEIHRRLISMQESRCEIWNGKITFIYIDRLDLVICDKENRDLLTKMIIPGRTAGIYTIATISNPDQYYFPEVSPLFPTRICLRTVSEKMSERVIGTNKAVWLMQGQAIIKRQGRIKLFEPAIIPDTEINEFLSRINI